MSRGPFRDDIQPDTIARFGRAPASAQNRTALHRSVGSNTNARPAFGRGTSVFVGGPGRQRVTVKIHLVRHHTPQQGRASLSRHARYIGRGGVSRHLDHGVFYGNLLGQSTSRDLARAWADDRHHFRVIISPERGHDVADLSDYTREVMRRVERDLGTRLEWSAVNHFNTDNPHVHVLLRGRDEHQNDLVINRDYIRHGWRERAQEVLTERLGQRTIGHAREAMQKQVHAERYTDLDRALERLSTPRNGSLNIDLTKLTLRPGAAVDVEVLHHRLRVLQGLGVADTQREAPSFGRMRSEQHSRRWRLHPGFSVTLRELGERNDVIKQIHQAMGSNAQNIASRVERLRSGPAPSAGVSGSRQVRQRPQSVVGVVLAKGPVDELTDQRFLVVHDIHASSQRPVHAVVRAAPEYDRACLGSVVRLTSTRHRESQLSIQASHRLDEQVVARAWTWLDRQLYRSIQRSDEQGTTWSPTMVRAINARSDWLVTNGYAERPVNGRSRESLRLKPGTRNKLQQAEIDASMPEASLLQPGQTATGRYLGTARLHLGTVVILDRPEGAVVVPVRRTPQGLEHESVVRAEISADRRVDFEVTPPASNREGSPRGKYVRGRGVRDRDDELELGGDR